MGIHAPPVIFFMNRDPVVADIDTMRLKVGDKWINHSIGRVYFLIRRPWVNGILAAAFNLVPVSP